MPAQGWDFLHSHGVIVMDIKPDNIFCNRSGSFQIGDFGMAVVSSLNWVRLGAPSSAPFAHSNAHPLKKDKQQLRSGSLRGGLLAPC